MSYDQSSVVLFVCSFFKAYANTESYTYRHTLSLHDALPIVRRLLIWHARRGTSMACATTGGCDDHPAFHRPRPPPCPSRRAVAGARMPDVHRDRIGCVMRLEEHTSELQSLMRISYAVFCVKKKQKTQSMNNSK